MVKPRATRSERRLSRPCIALVLHAAAHRRLSSGVYEALPRRIHPTGSPVTRSVPAIARLMPESAGEAASTGCARSCRALTTSSAGASGERAGACSARVAEPVCMRALHWVPARQDSSLRDIRPMLRPPRHHKCHKPLRHKPLRATARTTCRLDRTQRGRHPPERRSVNAEERQVRLFRYQKPTHRSLSTSWRAPPLPPGFPCGEIEGSIIGMAACSPHATPVVV